MTRWFECECGHVSQRPVHCGYSTVNRGTQGDFRRSMLAHRDGPGCRGCGTEEDLTLDHIIPRSRGGSNKLKNLQLLCEDCNIEKADLPQAAWLRKRKGG